MYCLRIRQVTSRVVLRIRRLKFTATRSLREIHTLVPNMLYYYFYPADNIHGRNQIAFARENGRLYCKQYFMPNDSPELMHQKLSNLVALALSPRQFAKRHGILY